MSEVQNPWIASSASDTFLRTFLQLASLLNAGAQSAAQQQLGAAEVSFELGRAMAEDIKSIATQEARDEIARAVMATSSASCASFFAHFGRPGSDPSSAFSVRGRQPGSDGSAGAMSSSVSALTAMTVGTSEGNATLSPAITDQMQKLMTAADELLQAGIYQYQNPLLLGDPQASSGSQPRASSEAGSVSPPITHPTGIKSQSLG